MSAPLQRERELLGRGDWAGQAQQNAFERPLGRPKAGKTLSPSELY
jgi:hypothetical protein